MTNSENLVAHLIERYTPDYLIREVTKTENIMVEADERVIKYEGKIKRLRKARADLYKKAVISRCEAEGRDDKGENLVELWRNGINEVE